MNASLPENWLLVRIGDLVERVESRSPADTSSENFHYIDISSVNNISKIVRSPSLIPVGEAPSRARQLVYPDDVLVSTVRPALNAVAMVPDNLSSPIASTGFCVLRAKPALLSPRYLFHFTISEFFVSRLVSCQKGGAYPAVSDGDVLAQLIPMPPLSEQQRIVDILQEAEAIRRLRSQAEAKTAELIPAMFHFAFSQSMGNTSNAKMIRLEAIADVQGGIQVTKSRDNAPLKVPYLRVANVQRDALDLAEMKEIGLTEAELERTRLLKGDILVVEGHGNPDELGRAAIWTGEINPCTHQNHLIRVRCKPGTDPAYVLSILNGSLGRRHFLTAGNTTSGLNTISTNIVRSFLMPVPTGEAMAEFATLREATLGLIGSEVRKANALSDKLTASLSAHAFTGQLTKDWRAARPKLLSKEARKRDDELDVAAGKPILINFSAADPEDEAEVWQQVPGISREQWLLLFQIRAMNLKKELPRYFTAELIADQIKGTLHRHPQAIKSHLTVFAVLGIIIPVSRARDAVPGKPFAASYRLPMNEEGAAPEQRDDVKAERMKHQRTLAAGKR